MSWFNHIKPRRSCHGVNFLKIVLGNLKILSRGINNMNDMLEKVNWLLCAKQSGCVETKRPARKQYVALSQIGVEFIYFSI